MDNNLKKYYKERAEIIYQLFIFWEVYEFSVVINRLKVLEKTGAETTLLGVSSDFWIQLKYVLLAFLKNGGFRKYYKKK